MVAGYCAARCCHASPVDEGAIIEPRTYSSTASLSHKWEIGGTVYLFRTSTFCPCTQPNCVCCNRCWPIILLPVLSLSALSRFDPASTIREFSCESRMTLTIASTRGVPSTSNRLAAMTRMHLIREVGHRRGSGSLTIIVAVGSTDISTD